MLSLNLMLLNRDCTVQISLKVWEYDWVQRQWSEEDSIAPLYTGRHSHACALTHDGEVVVVAGNFKKKNLTKVGVFIKAI